MNRSTSFFWLSDDRRSFGRSYDDDNADGDGEDDSDGGGDDDYELGGGGISWSGPPSGGTAISLCVEEGEESEEDESPEKVALNKSFKGYGSSFAVGDDDANPMPSGVRRRIFRSPASSRPPRVNGSSTVHPPAPKSIRFQVVIWHIGSIDVQTGQVKMRFRLTLFWNDDQTYLTKRGVAVKEPAKDPTAGDPADDVWVMEGRQRAYRKQWSHRESEVKELVDVPPVSILNAVDLEIVGDAPDVMMLNGKTRAMRWTCMYNASLFQGDHLSVRDFPHDVHRIALKVGILARRGTGGRWDHGVYRLELAREEDSRGSTRVPHGLVVDHCHVPDFGFDPSDLRFRFAPLMYGDCAASSRGARDSFLEVTLPVYRQSCYYDTSVLPTLVALNVIAVTCLTRNFASATAATEIMLSIAFVQVGIRLTLDSRLPSVGYQIKMQTVMNHCFWLLCGLVLESNTVFFLVKKRGWEISVTDKIDLAVACVALLYNVCIVRMYFRGKQSAPVPVHLGGRAQSVRMK